MPPYPVVSNCTPIGTSSACHPTIPLFILIPTIALIPNASLPLLTFHVTSLLEYLSFSTMISRAQSLSTFLSVLCIFSINALASFCTRAAFPLLSSFHTGDLNIIARSQTPFKWPPETSTFWVTFRCFLSPCCRVSLATLVIFFIFPLLVVFRSVELRVSIALYISFLLIGSLLSKFAFD